MSHEPPPVCLDHEAVATDLAWFANGTLGPEHEARVRAHLAQCTICRHDLAALEAMAHNLQLPDVVERSPGPALARVLPRIDAFETRRARTRAWLRRFAPGGRRWRALALPAAIAVQAIVILALVLRPNGLPIDAPDAPPRYRTLTNPAPLPADDVRLRVVFDDHASVADLRALLDQIDGELVAGPSAAGVLTVRLSRRDPGDSLRALEIARAHPGVRLAELAAALPSSGHDEAH